MSKMIEKARATRQQRLGMRARVAGVLLAAAMGVTACGDDGDEKPVDPVDGGVDGSVNIDGSTPDSGGGSNDGSVQADTGTGTNPAPLGPPANALYTIGTWVTAANVTTASIKTVPRLDVDQRVALTDSITAPGFGDVHVSDGKAFLSSGEAPIVKRYSVNADGTFSAEEGLVDFSTYASDAAIYKQAFISPTKAYLTGTTSWIVWNPSTLKIEKTIPFPSSIGPRENKAPFYSFDRGFKVRGNRAFQTVNWYDNETYNHLPTSAIVVLDIANDSVVTVLDNIPCPTLDLISADDAGNLYASPYVFAPGYTIARNGAKTCAVRILANTEVVDPSWKLTFSEVTGGHEGGLLRWRGDGTFVFAVFHEEKDPYTPTKVINEWVQSNIWTFATYNVNTKAFAEVPALGNHSGAFYSEYLHGQFFILTYTGTAASTTYQQLLPDLTVKKGITVDGWSTRAYVVR